MKFMTQEDKELLLLKDLCSRLPYGVKIELTWWVMGEGTCINTTLETDHIEQLLNDEDGNIEVKPYLRPMSSMTEEEAKELSILYDIKDILSIKITDEYIDFEVDDGFCSIDTKIIWYNDIISSIETFDWLNKNHFDYRGLIPMGLAIAVTKENNPYKE